MSYSPYDVPKLLADIRINDRNLTNGHEDARLQCLAAARTRCHALETPREAIITRCYAQMADQAAINTAIDLDLFQAIENGGGKGVHVFELSKETGADTKLLARLLKHLAATGTVYEADTDMFLSTSLSKALILPIYRDAFPVFKDIITPVIQKVPEFLTKVKYSNPENTVDAPFQMAFDTNEHSFAWLNQRPELIKKFANHMGGTHAGLSTWMEPKFYPLEQNLVKGAIEGKDFFVDVGGSQGHDLQESCRMYPQLPGRLVLQDQDGVIRNVTGLDPQIFPMAHDFFTPQPVRGARAYFMHRVLHDWPDSQCRAILAPLKDAMVRGYSKLLINENVIPNRGAKVGSTALDLLMMSIQCGSERTETDWKVLLESVGFKITKIWPVEEGSESLIEAELA